MRYHVIVYDIRDINSEFGPDSALIEDDRLYICEDILADYLQEYSVTVYAYKIIDTIECRVVTEWHR